MKRRTLLKGLGLGSVGLASLPLIPALEGFAPRPVSAAGDPTFYFVALSDAGIQAGVHHQIVMSGAGEFTSSAVRASGGFAHFDNAPPVPKPILGSGRWEATSLLGFVDTNSAGRPFGTVAGIHAGIVSMLVDLFPVSGAPIRGARLAVACNIGFAGVSTGEAEGFVLTLPVSPPGIFRPLSPNVGLTAIIEGVALPSGLTAPSPAPAAVAAGVQPPRTGDGGLLAPE